MHRLIKTVEVKTAKDLAELLEHEPGICRIVTDVGYSLCSGWGDLKAVNIYDDGTLELEFE